MQLDDSIGPSYLLIAEDSIRHSNANLLVRKSCVRSVARRTAVGIVPTCIDPPKWGGAYFLPGGRYEGVVDTMVQLFCSPQDWLNCNCGRSASIRLRDVFL